MKFVPLTKGYSAIVDDGDLPLVEKDRWYISASDGLHAYAVKSVKVSGKFKTISMHRTILGITDPAIRVDHVDGNGLNNQRHNLRLATHLENMWNRRKGRRICSSRYKGVHRQDSKWVATIGIEGKSRYIGRFATEEAAALSYNSKAKELYGEFARLNEVEGFPI